MKISYAVTVCDEYVEIQKLLSFLLLNKRDEDEIVVQQDMGKGKVLAPFGDRLKVFEYLTSLEEEGYIRKVSFKLNDNFADFKNNLNQKCTGEYIFQLDADEIPDIKLLNSLPQILEVNKVDVMMVPRVNTVEGLTKSHIAKWRWSTNEEGWVNYPDYQWRIYRNVSSIVWENKVHEVIKGFKTYLKLPASVNYSIHHPKTISKQEAQNNYYDTL